MPAPPAGATTIVLNWHWACAEPPPTLDVAGVTICVSCNIAISVRVGSPGNTGDLAQTIAAQTAATAAGIAQTIQTALQAAPAAAAPLPPTPAPLPDAAPAVIPPVGATPGFVLVAVPALHAYPIDAGILVTPFDDLSAEDAPRHGAPLSFGVPTSAGRQSAQSSIGDSGGVAGALSTALIAPSAASDKLLSPQRSTAGRTGAGSRSTTAGARRPARAPTAPTAPPSAPDPMVLAAGAPSMHGDGAGVVVAIASALALAFLYAVYSGLRTPSAVPPAGGSGAKPHPPG